MKIQTTELEDSLVIQVEGRLAGAFAPELENCWKAIHAAQPDRKIGLDLRNVTCVDRAGRCLLRFLHTQGVEFRNAGLALQDILDEICEAVGRPSP